MKKLLILCLALLGSITAFAQREVYLFAYTPENRNGASGMNFAWSGDGENWVAIGPEYDYFKCDYGRWGEQKKMYDPFLFKDKKGKWHCVWSLNNTDGAFAYASSPDLVKWSRQSYPLVNEGGNCRMVTIDSQNEAFSISWLDTQSSGTPVEHCAITSDFKTFAPAIKTPSNDADAARKKVFVRGQYETGTIHKVLFDVVDKLTTAHLDAVANGLLNAETTATDAVRFANLKPVEATIKIDGTKAKQISDMLIGIFFEDINYAADGGLYAELVQNRGFEYALSDKLGGDKTWNSYKAWSMTNERGTFTIDSVTPIHANNKHYAVLQINEKGIGLVNEGFDGIAITAGEKYNFSVFARTPELRKGKLSIRLVGKNGDIYGETTTKSISSDWQKYEGIIVATQSIKDAQLQIVPQMIGKVNLDMISLFPQKTFKDRKNGLRLDLAQLIADMKPRFVRFPGGCLTHGDGIDNIYHWKHTVGSLESRVPKRNIWNYHQSAGLGYFEYFQFCEDIGAAPIPIVAAGVPCQNSGHQHGRPLGGQQCGIPMDQMDDYIQDILDLIEWANGDKKTKWGKLRAQAGHPEPFNLKYIGVGNEDQITDVFEERFTMIFNALKEKHPEITVIGTAGPFTKVSTDYVEGWGIANKLGVQYLDEHYYQSPGWFINNQHYYDSYNRAQSKVYLGEYAAHLSGRPNTETALAEALYLTSIERNGDVVAMTSYAPLLAKEGHIQWGKDLIYFDNTSISPTVGYYVQKLYGQNSGELYINNQTTLSDNADAVAKRIGVSCVREKATGDVILKLVNMLPVVVTSKLQLSDILPALPTASKILLTAKPNDMVAMPQESIMPVSDNFTVELPAYSFMVIRIKTKN